MSGAITVWRSASFGITSRHASEVEVIPCSSTTSGPEPAAWKPTVWPWSSTSSYGPSGSSGAPQVGGFWIAVFFSIRSDSFLGSVHNPSTVCLIRAFPLTRWSATATSSSKERGRLGRRRPRPAAALRAPVGRWRLLLAAADLGAALLGLLRRADPGRGGPFARTAGEALEPEQAPADQPDQEEGERGDREVAGEGEPAGDVVLPLPLKVLLVEDELTAHLRLGGDPLGRDRRVLGHEDRQAGDPAPLVEAKGRLPGPVDRDRLGDPVTAGGGLIEVLDDALLAALPARRLEPPGVLGRVGRVEADGAGDGALAVPLGLRELEAGADWIARVRGDREGDDPDAQGRRHRDRRSRHPLGPGHPRSERPPDEAADDAPRKRREEPEHRALGEEGGRPLVHDPGLVPGPLAGEADRPDPGPAQGAEGDRPLGGGAAPEPGEGDRLDDERLRQIQREGGDGLVEDGADQEREQAADRPETEDRRDRAAGAEPDPGGDEGDPGGEHDQDRLQQERELRHREVELGLEGGEGDEKGAGEDHLPEPGPAPELATLRPALLVPLDVERPGAEHREGGAADQHQVGRPPEGDVLAVDPVPDVVEREGRERGGAANRDHHRPDGREPAGVDPKRGLCRAVRKGAAEDAGEEDAEEAGEDEVVGGVRERALVAAVVDVEGDVP